MLALEEPTTSLYLEQKEKLSNNEPPTASGILTPFFLANFFPLAPKSNAETAVKASVESRS